MNNFVLVLFLTFSRKKSHNTNIKPFSISSNNFSHLEKALASGTCTCLQLVLYHRRVSQRLKCCQNLDSPRHDFQTS